MKYNKVKGLNYKANLLLKGNKKQRTLSYKRYIVSKQWEDRKNKYYQSHKRQCSRCGSFNNIVLHHAFYERSMFGCEPDIHLFPFCRDCHTLFHETFGTKKDMIKHTHYFINRYKYPDTTPENNKLTKKPKKYSLIKEMVIWKEFSL